MLDLENLSVKPLAVLVLAAAIYGVRWLYRKIKSNSARSSLERMARLSNEHVAKAHGLNAEDRSEAFSTVIAAENHFLGTQLLKEQSVDAVTDALVRIERHIQGECFSALKFMSDDWKNYTRAGKLADNPGNEFVCSCIKGIIDCYAHIQERPNASPALVSSYQEFITLFETAIIASTRLDGAENSKVT
jgi:hypothetical protein